jgi:Tfp pilus assembly protein PilF
MKSKLIMAALAAAVLLLPARGSARATFEVVSPEQAWSNFLSSWEGFRAGMGKNAKSLPKDRLEAALAAKWDGGLGDLPVYSAALIEWARQQQKANQPENAAWLLEKAAKLAPNSVHVELCLARYYLGGGLIDPRQALEHYLRAVRLLDDDFPARLRVDGRWCLFPLAFLLLFGIVLAAAVIVRYRVALGHDFGDFFPPGKLPGWLRAALGGLILLLPLAAGMSWWLLLAWWLVLLTPYLKRAELVLMFAWLLCLQSAPVLVGSYARYFGSRADPVLMSALRVRDGVPSAEDRKLLAAAVERDPEDVVARFSLAELMRREGYLAEAFAMYEPLRGNQATAAEALNNTAVISFCDPSRLHDVEAALTEAANVGEGRGAVEINYNLSQYSQEQNDTLAQNAYLDKARQAGEDRLKAIQERYHAYRMNRHLAALPLPERLLWERVGRDSEAVAAIEAGLWDRLMGPIRGTPFAAAAGGAGLAALGLLIGRRRWSLAYRCGSCGDPICPRCSQPAKDPALCSPCYFVFRERPLNLDKQLEFMKRTEAQHYRDRWSRAGFVATVLLPGWGQMVLGFGVAGYGLAVLSVAVLAGLLTGPLAWPAPLPWPAGGVSGLDLAVGLAYAAVMVIALLVYRGHAERWR